MFRRFLPAGTRRAHCTGRFRLSFDTLESREVPANFTPGNLVIYRVGDGSVALSNTGSAVFLDEYAPDGTLVQSVAMPTTASGSNRQLIAGGTATAEGLLSRSENGGYLVLTGYARDLGGTGALSSTTSAAVPRVIGLVGADASIDTTTALTDASSGGSPRTAVSANGTDLWIASQSDGVRYTTRGGTTSLQLNDTVTTTRQLQIFGGQLYLAANTGSFRLGTVGTGLPTTAGQTITNLPGFETTGSPYGFFFADLDAGVAGLDTLYVANDDAFGLRKYSLVGGSWTFNGAIGVEADDYRGLTGTVSGTTVTLFGTRKGSEFFTLADSSGYNGAFSGTPTLLASAGTNKAFRGIAPAPEFNDAPVNTVRDHTTNEDVGISLTGTTVADADAGTRNIQVTFSVPAGRLNLQTTVAGGVTAGQVSGNDTTSVTVTAPLAAINKTLINDNFGGLGYFPVADANGEITVTMTTNDLGNSGFGGAKSDTDQFKITVFPVNDAPVNTVPGAQSVNEDAPLVFSAGNGNAISIADVDAGGNPVQVTLTATNGKLTLGGTANLTVSGNGTGTVVATGTVADLNTGLGGLTFAPAANYFGSATLTVVTNDQGNSGSGGAKSDSDAVAITVTAVNDAPVLNDASFLVNRQAADGTTVGTVIASDVENDTITYEITAGNTGNAFAIHPATGKITVATSAAVTGGPFLLTVTATDNGSPNQSDTATVTLTVNNPPIITQGIDDAAVFEDAQPYVVELAPVFGDDRDADSALKHEVVFTSNPALFSSVNITGTTLTLTLAANANGSSGMTVRATDTGGLWVEEVFALFVTSVNDAPTLAAIGDRTLAENAGEQSVALTGISAGPADESSQTVIVTAASDNLGLIPNPTVQYSGGANGTLKFTPAAGAHGTAIITVIAKDNGETNNGGVDTFTRTFKVTVEQVNDAPTLDPIGPVTIVEDAAEQTVSLAGISPGPPDESDQKVTVSATSGDPGLIPHPSVQYVSGATGSLKFTPVANAHGQAVITVTVTDDGGTANGGVDTFTRTFTVTVNPVNDAPVLNDAAFPVNQNAANGTVVGKLTATDVENDTITYTITAGNNGAFALHPATGEITVADATLVTGGPFNLTVSATDNGTPNESDTATVTLTVNNPPTTSGIGDRTVLEDSSEMIFDLAAAFEDPEQGDALTYTVPGNTNPSLFATAPSVTGTSLKMTPRPDAFGNSTITVRATDAGGLFAEATFTVTVTPVNDAPTLDAIDDMSVDEDSAEQTIALEGVTAGPANESGQGLTVVALSDNPAVVPNPSAVFDAGTGWSLKFTPVPDAVGSAEITVTVTDDGGTTNGGVNLVSRAFTIGVGSLDDRPVLNTAPTPMLPPAPVFSKVLSQGGLIADLTENITDADASALKGIAIVGVDNTRGKWQYNLTGAAAGWLDVPVVSPTSAFLLADDGDTRVRFVPKPLFIGFASLTFRAWDQSNGKAEGTPDDATDPADIAYSTATDRGWVTIGRTIPAVDADGRTLLPAVREDATSSRVFPVRSILGLAGREALPKTNLGVAITSASTVSGTWQFRLARTLVWRNVGAVSDSSALLLRPADVLRFIPATNADGEGALTFRVWDRTTGTPGTRVDSSGPAFGADPGVAALDIRAVNDAPVLDLSVPAVLNPVDAGQTTNAATFDSIMSATDVEGASIGVAIVQAAGAGQWEYRPAGGVWTELPRVSALKALLLDADTEVRFTANDPVAAGTATLSFRAWDRANGKLVGTQVPIAGTAFGRQVEVLTVAVANQAPVLADASPVLPAIRTTALPGAGVAVSALLGTNVTDPNGLKGIALVGADNAGGKWQYTLDGITWRDVGTVSDAAAVLLTGTHRVRFVPTGGFTGTATIRFKAWDRMAGRAGDRIDTTGSLNSFSAFTEEATITVIA